VAEWKKIINSEELDICSQIKDFGNKIHEHNRIKNYVDAKLAVQTSIHILRRLESQRPFTSI
jgi:hypothetical protein